MKRRPVSVICQCMHNDARPRPLAGIQNVRRVVGLRRSSSAQLLWSFHRV